MRTLGVDQEWLDCLRPTSHHGGDCLRHAQARPGPDCCGRQCGQPAAKRRAFAAPKKLFDMLLDQSACPCQLARGHGMTHGLVG
jgi:hypothetical protein